MKRRRVSGEEATTYNNNMMNCHLVSFRGNGLVSTQSEKRQLLCPHILGRERIEKNLRSPRVACTWGLLSEGYAHCGAISEPILPNK